MTLTELLLALRYELDDAAVASPLWTNAELVGYLNDACNRLCRVADVNIDSRTDSETLATGTVTLTAGTTGTISSVKVNNIELLTGPVAFSVDLDTTATALALAITASATTPDYTASATDAVVTISAVAGTGSNPNGYVVTVTTTGSITATTVDMSGGYALTKVYALAAMSEYMLDPRVLKVLRVRPPYPSATIPLLKAEAWELDLTTPSWEELSGTPQYYVLDVTTGYIVLTPKPDAVGTYSLTVSRLPLTELDASALTASPDIPELYHRSLLPWAKHMAYSKPDSQTLDLQKAKIEYDKFSAEVEWIHRERMKHGNIGTTIRPNYGCM